MKYYSRLLIISLLLSTAYSASKKHFTDRQIAAMVPKYFDRDHNSPNIQRIRIYGKEGQKYFHLEIDVNRNRYLGELDYTLSAMANIAQYAKFPFDKFVVVMHPAIKSDEPEMLETNAKCAIDYFIHKRISYKRWSEKCTKISSDFEIFVAPSAPELGAEETSDTGSNKNNLVKLVLFVSILAVCIGFLLKRKSR